MKINNIFFWRKLNKDLLRNILYLLAVAFIGYFMFTISSTVQDMTDKEIYEEPNLINPLLFEIKEFQTYGEYIWIICLSLLQIIFLVAFMLMLYKNE